MTDHAGRSTPGESETPPRIPDLDLIRPIGRGGFGEVWLAANQTTGHLRAVKVIPLSGLGSRDPAGREISSLTRLEANLRRQHAHLLNIHHVGKSAGHLFYVMDPADDVSGNPASADPGYRPATLQARLEQGPLPPEHCLGYAEQLLTGLAALHAAGMVHRDVKPANCLFVAGDLKLADFGLVTVVNPQVSRVGTEKYMPPDGRMDTRADVYAAGLVIYEMLSGLPADRFPCLGPKACELTEGPKLRQLVRLVVRACQPDPLRRFRHAEEMLAALRQGEREGTPGRRGTRRLVIVSGVLTIAALGLAVAGWWGRRAHDEPTGQPRTSVNFVTERPYFDAEVYLDYVRQTRADGSPYTTPCTIQDLPARVHRVLFRHSGLPDLEVGEVDFAKIREVHGTWDSRN